MIITKFSENDGSQRIAVANGVIFVYSKGMIETALAILVILFVLGYVSIPGVTIPNYHIYTFNNHQITFYEILIFFVIFWLLKLLPRYLRIVAGALLIIWIISTLGFIAIKGLPLIIIAALILVTLSHRSFHYYHRYRRRYY